MQSIIVLCSAVICNAVQFSSVQCSSVQCSAVQFCFGSEMQCYYSAEQYIIVPYRAVEFSEVHIKLPPKCTICSYSLEGVNLIHLSER